mmetsp:Transcript_44727/g.87652  ORF Transcript_44727/g.87652 Transcript_44727/m.87652 type:complete len:295 (+) Transcript_44727:25-909(+)
MIAALIFIAFAAANAPDPKYSQNITVFHVNEANYTGIANMDTGDAAGDAFFSLRSVYLPIECSNKSGGHHFGGDCDNPEVVGSHLTVTEVVVEVDSRYGNYSECNVCRNSTVPFTRDVPCTDGDYVCVCGKDFHHLTTKCPPTVGVEKPVTVFGRFPVFPWSPNYEWWLRNLLDHLDGFWYSTPKSGECTNSGTGPCYWRLVESKRRVLKSCQDKYIYNQISQKNPKCFNACPQPTNSTSTCFIECFFDTLLGPGSNHQNTTGAGLTQKQIVDLWTFPVQNDETKGGCPEYKPL